MVRTNQHLGPGLACRVRAAWAQGVVLAAASVLDFPVDLVGAHLHEALVAELAGGLQQFVVLNYCGRTN